MSQQPEVRENAAEQRFEIWLGDERAGMTLYQGHGQTLRFVHTEIDDRFAGKGLASILIREALDTVRGRGLSVLPHCPFVKRFIQKHPEYVDLVPQSQRKLFDLPETAAAADS
jgi:uncharacterized protein